MSSYNNTILNHYKSVAEKHGLNSSATMEDSRIRFLETELIVKYVGETIKKQTKRPKSLVIGDVGCGNGYTLEIVRNTFPDPSYIGVEYSPDLRALAQERSNKFKNITVVEGDIRNKVLLGEYKFDILICQRVLINLLDSEDQRCALENLADALNPNGRILFLEAFQSGLQNLNDARAEFGFESIQPAHHNLYLEDGFFSAEKRLKPIESYADSENFLSTHFFTTRVLHPLILGDRPFIRNSHFVQFFSKALKENVGNYSPVRCYVFEKVPGEP